MRLAPSELHHSVGHDRRVQASPENPSEFASAIEWLDAGMSLGRQRKNQISEQFASRPIAMLESPGYRALSRTAHQVLARIEIESAHHGGKENGRLPVTYDDFEKYGIHRHAIRPAISELVALGFIEITEHGRAGNAEWRKPNLFRLTYRHAKDEAGDGTHEWRRLTDLTAEEADAVVRTARKSGDKIALAAARKKQNSSGGKRQVLVAENRHYKR
jgi:hypothetical protein